MLHFKIKRCGYPGCKKPASYECSCGDLHPEDVEGWATPPKDVTKHPRYVCEEHSQIPEPVEEKMKVERKITITLSKDDLFAYILKQEGMNIKDAVIDVEVGSDNDMGDVTWTELKGDIRVDVQSYAGADEPEMNSDVKVVDD